MSLEKCTGRGQTGRRFNHVAGGKPGQRKKTVLGALDIIKRDYENKLKKTPNLTRPLSEE